MADRERQQMPEQAPELRRHNFDEVALGYTPAQAALEAQRCLNCRNAPCMQGCPVSVRIPAFISQIVRGDYAAAYETITATNALPAVCGRVCPQERQCEARCVRGIKGKSVAIGALERFAADNHGADAEQADVRPGNGQKVAVVGSGPSGLTAAGDLIRLGYEVTVFEAFHTPGGVLMYGIPEFRLPKDIVRREIDRLRDLGVNIETNVIVGKTLTVDELLSDMGFDAVYIGTGAGLPSFLGVEGEDLKGVCSANEFLTRINLMKAYRFPEYDTPVYCGKNVAVFGGGNVAMDAARSALRLGAEHVYILYRRGREELPARAEEIVHAEQEGIEFRFLCAPVRFLGDEAGWLTGVELRDMVLGEPDESGRRRPVPVEGSEHVLPIDTAVVAIGQSPNPLIRKTTEGLETTRRGCIVADETGATTKPLVYAGGDAVTGAATVILAMGAGKTAAAAIHRTLTEAKHHG